MKLFNNEFLNLPTLKRSKLLFFIAASFSSIIVSSESTYSNELAKCKDLTLPSLISDGSRINGGYGCTMSPTSYKVKAFELGLCTEANNPFSTTGLDTSGCFAVWSDPNGYEANLVSADGSAAVETLNSSNAIRPPAGTYKHAYVIIDDTIKLRATLELAGETWKTSNKDAHLEYFVNNKEEGQIASLGKVSTEDADETETRLGYFNVTGNDADDNCYLQDYVVDSAVTLNALMLKSDKKTIATKTTATSNFNYENTLCSGSQYIAGVETFTTPIVVTENTTSATLTFDTTDVGVWVEGFDGYSSIASDRGPGGSDRPYFDMGPFVIRISVN